MILRVVNNAQFHIGCSMAPGVPQFSIIGDTVYTAKTPRLFEVPGNQFEQ